MHKEHIYKHFRDSDDRPYLKNITVCSGKIQQQLGLSQEKIRLGNFHVWTEQLKTQHSTILSAHFNYKFNDLLHNPLFKVTMTYKPSPLFKMS